MLVMKSYIARDLKNLNRKTIYKYIVSSPNQTVSCAQVARETGISMPTTLKVAEYFLQKGILVDIGESQSNAVGRRPTMLRFHPNVYYSAVCVYNGQYLEIALVNMNCDIISANRLRVGVSMETLLTETLPDALNAVMSTSHLEEQSQLIGIGIALPVIMDGKRQRSEFPAPLVGLQSGFDFAPFCRQISERFHCAVHLENDVNAAALGEFRERGLSERDDMVYITVGTGVGSGLILGGHLRRGRHNTAGEIGNMVFEVNGGEEGDPVGSLESRLALPYLEEHFGYHPLDETSDGGEQVRQKVAEHIAEYLELSILNMNAVLDNNLFVLGGFVIDRLEPLILERLNEKLKQHCLTPIHIVKESSRFSTAKGMGSIVMDRMLDSILSDEIAEM